MATRFLREMKKAEKERGTINISEVIKAVRALWERSRGNSGTVSERSGGH